MKSPTLSVCIPNYNHAHYLSETLESILAQSYSPMEIIVVDDASTDNSIEVIQGFADEHSNIRVLKNDSNQGGILSTKRGMDEAKGDYVFAIAADDKILPRFFEKSIAFMEEHKRAGLCAVALSFIDSQSKFITRDKLKTFYAHTHQSDVEIRSPTFLSPDQLRARLRRQPWFIGGASHVLFRRSALAEIGGYVPELGALADWFTVHTIALKHGICYIPEPLVAFRIMPDSLGTSTMREPKLAIDCFAEILRLMHEPKYRAAFPETFIDEKRPEFTYAAFRASFVLWRQKFIEELSTLAPPRTLVSKVILWLMSKLLLLQHLMLRTYCYRSVALAFEKTPTQHSDLSNS